jgi:hypothetical protein
MDKHSSQYHNKEKQIMQIQTNTETVASNEKLYDLCMIEMLCHGNREKVKRMVMVFIDQVPKSIEEMKLAFIRKDFDSIGNIAHRIKPVLSYYAIIKVEKDILLIEKWADERSASNELELKIKKLDTVVAKIVQQLKKDFLYN